LSLNRKFVRDGRAYRVKCTSAVPFSPKLETACCLDCTGLSSFINSWLSRETETPSIHNNCWTQETMKVRPAALFAFDLLLVFAIHVSEGCDAISRKTATTANTAKSTAPVQQRCLAFDLLDLRGGGRTSLIRRKRQKETKRFFAVNAVMYLGLLLAMAQTGVFEFVELVNISVFAMWWISFAVKPIKALIQNIVGHKETSACQRQDKKSIVSSALKKTESSVQDFMQKHFLQPARGMASAPQATFFHVRCGFFSCRHCAFVGKLIYISSIRRVCRMAPGKLEI
jgi:hypothetical protein